MSYEDGDTVPLSFKLKFLCLNNTTEYEAYLIGLAIALGIRDKAHESTGRFQSCSLPSQMGLCIKGTKPGILSDLGTEGGRKILDL